MRTIILFAICLLSFAAPIFCQVTPDNIFKKQCDHWEQVFNTALLNMWNGRFAIVDIGWNEAGAMTDQLRAELCKRFAKNGWTLEFTTPARTVGGYLPEECIRVFIRLRPRDDKEAKPAQPQPETSQLGKPKDSEQVAFTRIFAGFGPQKFETAEFYVVQDRKAYHELVAGKLKVMYENTPDFNKITVLAVFAGTEITKIAEHADKVYVFVDLKNKQSAEPSFIVKCRKLTKPIKFVFTAEEK